MNTTSSIFKSDLNSTGRAMSILQSKNLMPDNAEKYSKAEPTESFVDENGMKCKKYLNVDGSYTIVKERKQRISDFFRIKNVPDYVVEKYDASGKINKKTEHKPASMFEHENDTITSYDDNGNVKSEANISTFESDETTYMGYWIEHKKTKAYDMNIKEFNNDGNFIQTKSTIRDNSWGDHTKVTRYDSNGKKINNKFY